tara:strand:- start:657 stop:1286 length:630 start_codon:yes stop_codon:yes gene_type:complete
MKIYKPKEDFVQAINIQNTYVELLKIYHKELTEKVNTTKGFQQAKYRVEIFELASKLDEQVSLLKEKIDHFDNNFVKQYDIELKECEENFDKIIKDPKKLLKKNFDKWYDYLVETQNESYKEGKNLIRKKFTDDFEKVVTQDDIEEQKERMRTAISFQKKAPTILSDKKEKIDFYIKDWEKLEDADKNHIEIKNVLYKDLRNLVTFPQI